MSRISARYPDAIRPNRSPDLPAYTSPPRRSGTLNLPGLITKKVDEMFKISSPRAVRKPSKSIFTTRQHLDPGFAHTTHHGNAFFQLPLVPNFSATSVVMPHSAASYVVLQRAAIAGECL
jgi:hypothetical protein